MNILDKLMGDYTHAVYYIDGNVQKEYRCHAQDAVEALNICQGQVDFPIHSCAIVTKEENE